MRFLPCLLLCSLTLTSCGSPRHDGKSWSDTYPNGGETIKEIETLYGKPDDTEIQANGDIINRYIDSRTKKYLGVGFTNSHHTVTFHNGKAVSWK